MYSSTGTTVYESQNPPGREHHRYVNSRGRKEEWLGPWEYDKMVDTYIYVKEQTGIEDKNTKTINE